MRKTAEEQLNPIEISYIESFEKYELKNHFHNSHEIIHILEGKAIFKIHNKQYPVTAGSMFFINNLEHHELEIVEVPYKRSFILIKPDYFASIITEPVLASIFKHRPEHFQHLLQLQAPTQQEAQWLVKRMYEDFSQKRDLWELSLKSSLQLLLVMLYRSSKAFFPLSTGSKSANTILEIQKYIDENMTEPITLSQISKLFYNDPYYISHLFRKITGYSFKDYVILQRISKAKDLLFFTSQDITAVGLNSGFNNVNHFIRIFKKYVGTTPYQFRKLHSRK